MSNAHAAHASHGFDELDPHGAGKHTKHSHHIVSGVTLLGVLGILLAFTALTVGLAQGEKWVMAYFSIELPRWVNVAVAMSIATVKATLVLMYFMLLRYSNPINTIVFLVCLLAFALFLFFTGLDLSNRGNIDPVKANAIQAGGVGGMKAGWGNTAPVIDKAAVVYWRERKLNEVGPEKYAKMKAAFSHSHAAHDSHGPTGPTGNAAAVRAGLTPGLFDAAAPASHDGHDSHGADSHAAPAKPAATH
ncbi:MAG TPA: cytochrome C oxidase subunit IV family protein [Phycisphaerales bacterium]